MQGQMPEYTVFHPDPAILSFSESLIFRISACQKGRFDSNTNGLNIWKKSAFIAFIFSINPG
jgi:hypothetical protein